MAFLVAPAFNTTLSKNEPGAVPFDAYEDTFPGTAGVTVIMAPKNAYEAATDVFAAIVRSTVSVG